MSKKMFIKSPKSKPIFPSGLRPTALACTHSDISDTLSEGLMKLEQTVDTLTSEMTDLKEELAEARNGLKQVLDTLGRLNGNGHPSASTPPLSEAKGPPQPLEDWFRTVSKGNGAPQSGNVTPSAGGLSVSREQLAEVLAEAQSNAAQGVAANGGGPALSLDQLDRSLKRARTVETRSPTPGAAENVNLSLADLARLLRQTQAGASFPKAPSAHRVSSPPQADAGVRANSPQSHTQPSAITGRQTDSLPLLSPAPPTYSPTGPKIDVNLMANLVRWVGSARRKLGLNTLQETLEIYAMSNNLPGAIQAAIYQAAKLDLDADAEPQHPPTYDEVADALLQLHGIVYGSGAAPACPDVEFDITKNPLTLLVRERDETTDAAETDTGEVATPDIAAAILDIQSEPQDEAPKIDRDSDVDTVVHETVAEIVAAYGADPTPTAEKIEDESKPGPADRELVLVEATAPEPNGTGSKTDGDGSAEMTVAAGSRKSYASDLTDGEWRRVESLVPRPKSGGRPSKYARREVLNGILYQIRTGCSWRSLPQDLPPWKIVHHYFRTWRDEGIWDPIAQSLGALSRLEPSPAEPAHAGPSTPQPAADYNGDQQTANTEIAEIVNRLQSVIAGTRN